MRPYYYLGNGRGLTALTTGQLFFVNSRARDLTPWIVHLGLWETFVDDILCALARPGDTFLDVGANQGYYSVKIGGLTAPDGRIYAFEPNPVMYSVFCDNMNINGFDPRSQVFNVAAGDGAAKTSLVFQAHRPGGAHRDLHATAAEAGHDRVEIDVVAIDDALPADAVANLIKIDVEGHEPMVLAGMRGLLARSPDAAIVTEVSYHHWARFGDPVTLLREAAGDRRMFRIFHDGHIEELTDNIEQAMDQTMVCYMLLLPRTDDAWARVARFATTDEAAMAAVSEAALEAAPPIKRSLARRAAGLLMRLVFPRDP